MSHRSVTSGDSAGGSETPVVGRARCEYSSGRSELVYVLQLGPSQVQLHSEVPPPPGSLVSLELLIGTQEVPALSGQVLARDDVARGEGLGRYWVRFRAMSERSHEALMKALAAVRPELVCDDAEPEERRTTPRVWLSHKPSALLSTESGQTQAQLDWLSASGAFVLIDGERRLALGLEPGGSVAMDIVLDTLPERIVVAATVVRHNARGESEGMGVRFNVVSSDVAARLEGVVRYVLQR